MALTDEDRRVINDLVMSNNRLAQEVAVQNVQMTDIRKILFGEKADGFLYEFAAVRADIQSIPKLAEEVRNTTAEINNLIKIVTPLIKRVRAIDRYIFRQRVRTAVTVSLIAGVVSFATMVAGLWSGAMDTLATIRGHK